MDMNVMNTLVLPNGILALIVSTIYLIWKGSKRAPIDRMDAISSTAEGVMGHAIGTYKEMIDDLRAEMIAQDERHAQDLSAITQTAHEAQVAAKRAEAKTAELGRELSRVLDDVATLVVWIDAGTPPPAPGALDRLRSWHTPKEHR